MGNRSRKLADCRVAVEVRKFCQALTRLEFSNATTVRSRSNLLINNPRIRTAIAVNDSCQMYFPHISGQAPRTQALDGSESRPKECSISTRLGSPRGAPFVAPGSMLVEPSPG